MLEITVDPRTGEGSLEARRGRFHGRRVDAMLYADVLLLLDECRRADPPSAKLLEVHIDKLRARERKARTDRERGASPHRGDEMSRERLEIHPARGDSSAER